MKPIREQYLSWPEQLKESYNYGLEIKHGEVDLDEARVVVGCGMGGSGFSLYTIKPLIENKKPYIIQRSDTLPPYINKEDLVIGVSYSGETYETISCIKKAIEKGAKTVIIAGVESTLYSIGLDRNAVVVGVKKTGFPRSSLASLVGGLLAALFGEKVKDEVDTISSSIDVDKAWSLGEEIANLIWNNGNPYLPIVASCGSLGFVAERWATEFAENAKHPALVEVFPEAGHNAVARWYYTRGNYATIYIDFKANRLCDLIRNHIETYYAEIGPVKVIDVNGETTKHPLAGVLYSVLIAGLTSVKLAELLGRNPEVIEGIDVYKKSVTSRLKEV